MSSAPMLLISSASYSQGRLDPIAPVRGDSKQWESSSEFPGCCALCGHVHTLSICVCKEMHSPHALICHTFLELTRQFIYGVRHSGTSGVVGRFPRRRGDSGGSLEEQWTFFFLILIPGVENTGVSGVSRLCAEGKKYIQVWWTSQLVIKPPKLAEVAHSSEHWPEGDAARVICRQYFLTWRTWTFPTKYWRC